MQEIANTQQNQPIQWSEQSLPAKLDELLMGSDLPTIGPKSAETLQQFVDAPRPPMPDREQVEVMIAKLSLATASQKRSLSIGRFTQRVSKAAADLQVHANASGDRFGGSR